MPEGVEIGILTWYLNHKIVGNILNEIKIISGKYTKQTSKATTICGFKEFQKDLPMKITALGCYGKFIYWEFSKDWYCFMTLGLSGRVLINQETDHKRVEFITNKHIVNYSDMRNFGTIHFYKGRAALTKKLKSFGYDLLRNYNLKDATKFIGEKMEKIRNQKKTIAEVMLNQNIYVGVGNYIRSEALFKANISPFTEIKDIKGAKLKKLIESIRYIMKKSFDAQLKCLKKDGYNYEKLTSCYEFQVYQQKKTPDGRLVQHKKLGQGGRMIWYV